MLVQTTPRPIARTAGVGDGRSRGFAGPAPFMLVKYSAGGPWLLVRHRHGLGALNPQAQSIAGMAASAASATGVLIGALAAIPIAGPIAAAIAGIGIVIANVFGGCGNTCVAASQIADQVGAALQQNLDTYLSAPVRYASMQAAALNNFDGAWAALSRACSDPNLGDAGSRCISDRARGSCHWHTSPGGWSQDAGGSWSYTPPGPDGSGSSCWNWFVGLRDPIASDPAMLPDPVGASVLSAVGLGPGAAVFGVPVADLILPAGLIFAGLLL